MTEEDVLLVLKERYSFSAPAIVNIVLNNRRGVWKVKEGNREYAIKHFRFQTGFSIWLNELLAKKSLSPAVLRTNERELFVIENGTCFYITNWVAGTITKDPIEYIRSVASFHREAQVSGHRLGPIEAVYGPQTKEKWLRIYQKKLMKLRTWSEEAEGKPLKEAFATILNDGKRMAALIEMMDLEPYMEDSLEHKTVVHWDLHRGNILISNSRPIILDLDSAEISFQVCDFHQVLSDLMEKMAVHPENLDRIFKEYFTVYPNSQKYRHIYLAVCRFPHYFWTIAERLVVYSGGVNADPEQLCKLSKIEHRKSELIQRWMK